MSVCSSSQLCNLCATDFYLANDKKSCIAKDDTKTWTPNCGWENANSNGCAECKASFYLESTTGVCTSDAALSNCIMATSGVCTECAYEYIYDGTSCVMNNGACAFGCAVAVSGTYKYDWPEC
jgi:hypothetical protein